MAATEPASSPSNRSAGDPQPPSEGDPQLRSPREIYFHLLSFTPVRVATALNRPPKRGSSNRKLSGDEDERRGRVAEIVDGTPHVRPRSPPLAAPARTRLSASLGRAFDRGRDG